MNSMMGYHIDKRPPHEVMRLTEEQTAGWDMEVINPVLFERNKDRSIEDVLDELKQTYEKVLAKLDGMSFEELMAPRHADDFSGFEGLEDDPKAMGQMMRKMGKEMGEDLPPEFDEVVDRLEKGQSPEDIEKAIPDLGGDSGGDED
jgi:hypothetical protein